MSDEAQAMTTSVGGVSDLSLIEMMSVRPSENPGVFIGRGHLYGMMGIYGGHFLGQALAAGLATVDEPKTAHSFHAYFLRKGEPDAPIEYRVHTLRNGRGTDSRTISAWQNDNEVFHMMASFKLAEDGHRHQPIAPTVGDPDDLVADRQARGDDRFPFPPTQNGWTQMEWASASFREPWGDQDPALRVWMRVPGSKSFTIRQRQIVLAFLSDGPLMFNSILPYGIAMETHWATTIDQSVWFHDIPDTDQWMLFDQRSTAAADGRGLNEGEIYTKSGALAMSCVQESVLRAINPETRPGG